MVVKVWRMERELERWISGKEHLHEDLGKREGPQHSHKKGAIVVHTDNPTIGDTETEAFLRLACWLASPNW